MNTNDSALLKESLVSLGAEESELDNIIDDVNGVILERIIMEYFEKNDPEIKKLITTMSLPELNLYLAQHKNELPPLAEEHCKAIAEETWADYFNFMKEKI